MAIVNIETYLVKIPPIFLLPPFADRYLPRINLAAISAAFFPRGLNPPF